MPMKPIALLFAFLLLGGCASFDELLPDEDSSEYEPLELDYSLPPTTGGGLFRSGYGGSLVSDKRAVRVGDILTIVLDESTQSSKSAGTSFGKQSSIGVGVPTVLGKTYPDVETAASAERDFSGSARVRSRTPCAARSPSPCTACCPTARCWSRARRRCG